MKNVIAGDPNPRVRDIAENGLWWSALSYLPDSKKNTAGATNNLTFKQMGEYVPDEKITFDEFKDQLNALNQPIYAYEFSLGFQRLENKFDDPFVQKLLLAQGFGAQFKQFAEKRTAKWNESAEYLRDRLDRLSKIKEKLIELKETKLYKFEPDSEKRKKAAWNANNFEELLSDYDLLSVVGTDLNITKNGIWEPEKIYLSNVTTNLAKGVGLPPAEVTRMAFKIFADPKLSFEEATNKLVEKISKKKWAQVEDFQASLRILMNKSDELHVFIQEHLLEEYRQLPDRVQDAESIQMKMEQLYEYYLNPDIPEETKNYIALLISVMDFAKGIYQRGETTSIPIGHDPVQMMTNCLERLSAHLGDIDAAAKDMARLILARDISMHVNDSPPPEELEDLLKEFIGSLKASKELAEELNISKNSSKKELINSYETSLILSLGDGEFSKGKTGIRPIPSNSISKKNGTVSDLISNSLVFADLDARTFIDNIYKDEHKEYVPIWADRDAADLFDHAAAEFMIAVKNVRDLFDVVDLPKEEWNKTKAWKALFQMKFDSEKSAKFLAGLFCETKMFYCDNGSENKSELVEAKIKEFLDAVQTAQEEDVDGKINDYVNNALDPVIIEYEKLNELAQKKDWDVIEEYLHGSGLNRRQIDELMAVGPFKHSDSYRNRLYGLIKEIKSEEGTKEPKGELSEKDVTKKKNEEARMRAEWAEKKKIADETFAVFEKTTLMPEELRRAKILLRYMKDIVMEGLRNRDTALYQDLKDIKNLRQVLPVKFADEKLLVARLNRSMEMAEIYSEKFGKRYHELDDLHKSFYNILRHYETCIETVDAIEGELEEQGAAAFDEIAKKLAGWIKTGEDEYEEPKWKQNSDLGLKGKKYSKRNVVKEVVSVMTGAVVRALTEVPDVRDRILAASGEKMVSKYDIVMRKRELEARIAKRQEERILEASMRGVGGGILAP